MKKTNVFNTLGDELVFFQGESDLGAKGWFSGWKANIRGRISYHPVMFFENEEDMKKEYDKVINGETEGYLPNKTP